MDISDWGNRFKSTDVSFFFILFWIECSHLLFVVNTLNNNTFGLSHRVMVELVVSDPDAADISIVDSCWKGIEMEACQTNVTENYST